jgi:hypothetical protein
VFYVEASLLIVIVKQFARISHMQGITHTQRLSQRHIAYGIDTILISGDMLLRNAQLFGQLLLRHATLQP